MNSRSTSQLVIIGLGNPGKDYEETRHNAGFLVIEELAQRRGLKLKKALFRPWLWARERKLEGSLPDLTLVQPLTYMNASGDILPDLMKTCDIDQSCLIVVFDSLDLPAGRIRIKSRGSSGGQRGVQSIINNLGHKDFVRIAVGIGRPENRDDVVSWVLSRPEDHEKELFCNAVTRAADAVETLAEHPVDKVMNMFNTAANGNNGI